MSELLPPRPLVRLLFEGGSYSSELASTAATIRGWLLFYTIRVNTVHTYICKITCYAHLLLYSTQHVCTSDSEVLQLKEATQLIRQDSEQVTVESEVPQLEHVSHLSRQTPELVPREVQQEQVGETRYVCRYTLHGRGGGCTLCSMYILRVCNTCVCVCVFDRERQFKYYKFTCLVAFIRFQTFHSDRFWYCVCIHNVHVCIYCM